MTKPSKVGPREQQLRDMRERRAKQDTMPRSKGDRVKAKALSASVQKVKMKRRGG